MAKSFRTIGRHLGKMRIFLLIALLSFLVGAVEGFIFHARLSQSMASQQGQLSMIRLSRENEVLPGSELFPEKKGPYIPSGLSAEEYSKIKKDDSDRVKTLNLGAWGPRFKRSDVPDGDWMVIPSLWTRGFNAQPQGAATGRLPSTYEGSEGRIALAATFLRNWFPALLLSFIFIDTLATAVAMSRIANLTSRQTLMTILKVPSLKGSLPVHLSSILKAGALKLTAMALVAPVMVNVLDSANRRRLWSNRRTIGLGAGLSLGSLSLWAFVLRLKTFLG